MARDRFVYFNEKVPSRADLQQILKNYFGGCGDIEEDRPDWWLISLPGQMTSPFDGIEGGRAHPAMDNEERRRCIEVVYSSKATGSTNVDVLTRAQDEFTNAIADELARALARFYTAQLETT